jgi:hypothetical protein
MSVTIAPSMTVQQIAEIVEANKAHDMDVYVRIESYQGKPYAYLVREDTSRSWIPQYLRQAE